MYTRRTYHPLGTLEFPFTIFSSSSDKRVLIAQIYEIALSKNIDFLLLKTSDFNFNFN